MNREQARRLRFRIKDRKFTKKGYAFGNKIGGKTLAIAEHFYKRDHKEDK